MHMPQLCTERSSWALRPLRPVINDMPIDQKNDNGSRPKITEYDQEFVGSPSADLIFLLDIGGLCIENSIPAKKTALIQNCR